jgi:hypothetical protein
MRGSRAPMLRRLLGVLAIAASVSGVALAGAPAQAASGAYIHPEWVDGCPGCPGPIFLVQRELDQKTIVAVTANVQAGLSSLMAARHEQDPKAAAKWTAAAVGQLTKSSALTGHSAFSPVADGDDVELCPRWPWPWPWPVPPPRWWDVESQFADGINLLGQADITKDPKLASEIRNKGIEELGGAAAGLDQYQGCTG